MAYHQKPIPLREAVLHALCRIPDKPRLDTLQDAFAGRVVAAAERRLRLDRQRLCAGTFLASVRMFSTPGGIPTSEPGPPLAQTECDLKRRS
jgi:hypothetical protein